MSPRRKKNTLFYAIALIYSLTTIFITYSCNTDEHYADETQIAEDGTAKMHEPSSRMLSNENTLIDSIAGSNEFWEFEMSSELLANKFHDYTSNLSSEEYDKFMENMNNDDYVKDFMKKANLENELQQMAKAKENLIQHTGFLRLSEDEQIQLFILYAESNELTKVKFLKTRKEGGDTNSCEEQKQAAYNQAKADYDKEIINCKQESTPSNCIILAAAKYDRNKRMADRAYTDCIKE